MYGRNLMVKIDNKLIIQTFTVSEMQIMFYTGEMVHFCTLK